MSVLLVASHQPGAGKTAIAAGLATLMSRSGANASACKPISPAGRTDPDAFYFAASLRGGIAVSPTEDDVGLDAAASAVRSLTGISDHVVVEVANPAIGSGVASPIVSGLAQRLSARVVAVFGYEPEISSVNVSSAVATLGSQLAGVIINQTPRYRIQRASAVLSELSTAGVPVIGALPEDRTMLSLSLDQLESSLGGTWELEPADGDVWIDRFLIGGNIMDSGAGYFGRYGHQAVITRVERPDIQLASLMQDTRCLVLTGGSRPTEYIRVEAAKRNVPVLLVESGTVAVADAVGGLMSGVVPYAGHKAERMADLLQEQVDLDTLLS